VAVREEPEAREVEALAAERESLACKVEGIGRRPAALEVRMTVKPRIRLERRPRIVANCNDPPDLEPSEDPVLGRTREAPSFLEHCGTEKTEEEKEIARADARVTEMPLGGRNLPERSPPARPARERTRLEIGIEVAEASSRETPARQLLDELRDPSREIAVADAARHRRRNREGARLAVNERARTAAGGRVEAFAAENEAHDHSGATIQVLVIPAEMPPLKRDARLK